MNSKKKEFIQIHFPMHHLDGEVFSVLQKVPGPNKNSVRYLVQAPMDGPRFWVETYDKEQRAIQSRLRRACDVVFGDRIRYKKEEGYFDKQTGNQAYWSRQDSSWKFGTPPVDPTPVIEDTPEEEKTKSPD